MRLAVCAPNAWHHKFADLWRFSWYLVATTIVCMPVCRRPPTEARSTLSTLTNAFQQPIGHPVPDWSARPRPERIVLEGRYCRLEPLDAERHAADLHAAYSQAPDGSD